MSPSVRRGGGVLRSVVPDVRPLRTSAGFRWLYACQVGAQLARRMLLVAVPYHVYVVTGSTWLVGVVSLAQVVPLILGSLFGGAAADVVDRRRLLVIVHVILAACGVGLAVSVGMASVWPVFVLMALIAGLFGVESPAKLAMIPSLVPRSLLASAFALNQVLNQGAHMVGPALAGALIAGLGLNAAYGIAAAFSLLTAVAALQLRAGSQARGESMITLRSAFEGWRYLRRAPLLQQTFTIDIAAMVLAVPYALFPAVGTTVLGGDAATVGLLYAAPGAGAMAGALTTGWVPRVRRQGRAVVISVVIWGLAVAGFGFATNLVVALAALAVAGAADTISSVFRNTILQLAIPGALRGRMSAIHEAVTAGGPHVGDARAGAVASLTSPAFSAVSGGVTSILGAVAIAGWGGRHLWRQSVQQEQQPTTTVACEHPLRQEEPPGDESCR